MFENLSSGSAWTRPVSARGAAPAFPSGTLGGLDTWSDGWAVPVFTGSSASPLRPVLYHPEAWGRVASGAWKRSGNSATTEREILAGASGTFPHPGNVYSSTRADRWALPDEFNRVANAPGGAPRRFFVPAPARPAPAWDGHLVVRQPGGRALECYAAVRLSSGEIVCLSYSLVNLRGACSGYENGQTASMCPVVSGVMDDPAVVPGGLKHALALTVPAAALRPAFAAPAFAFDRGALTENPPYAGDLPMGAKLTLPARFDPQDLGTPEGRAIGQALQTYGGIIADRGGSGVSFRVRANPAAPNPRLRAWDWGLQEDLNALVGALVRAG